MKIIHLILGKARLDRMNGINKVAHNLALHQARMGHTVQLWGITPTPDIVLEPRAYEMHFFQAQSVAFSLDPHLVNALRSLDPKTHHFHIHGSFIPAFFRISRWLVRLGIPYTYCPHGSLSPGALEKHPLKKRIYFYLLESRILKHAHRVHFLGTVQYEAIDQWLPLRRKILIPNGQNLEELDFRLVGMDRPAEPVLAYCGRLDAHHKGLDLLLAGVAKYQQKNGRMWLWLIGDGPDRGRLEAQARALKITEQVIFWGSRFGEDKLNLLAHSDAFVHCSRYEGMPTGVLEAAGMGLPCLLSTATNLGFSFAASQAGWHLIPNDPEGIAEGLERFAQARKDNRLPEMGKNARRLVETEFNWGKIAGEVLAAYE